MRRTTNALLELLKVQTKLEVCASSGVSVAPAEAKNMAAHINNARSVLQESILEAGRILVEGPAEK